ncbi:DUF1269 domain-containing protein [Conyzicola nivalis]|uniref:Membrane protein n=1 Tax=Conyzicola nivalis TaxID=1477021 RepID=A0A916SFX7_9MICO|nr:DUF1269 domain-containing protein [Conyzicola nivalis]GGA98557.1 membrane protein [Conyzicola nivalis]
MTSTLSVWKFDSVNGAVEAEKVLLDLQRESLITVDDAAVVSWEVGSTGPKTRQLTTSAGAGALGGSFWGLLFGLIFFVPLLGTVVGAVVGGIAGSLSDVGIDDTFLDSVRDSITPGTSALFVLTSGAVIDRVADAFEGVDVELIDTNLSHDDEAKLREVFGA